ncbi:hypothetical protein O3G_MSEX011726 [Manduca sexta]|uniref:TIL domain-containing protein n=1 Tax=Manduca sexta TaxID=7130 RepID=A0A921ZLT4_MANSE|nr:hypothetical protein O3G_MSEX011726 [Manduca sexta]
MKLWTSLLIFCFAALVSSQEKCREDEYNPGPNCGTEPTCAPPSSHFAPKTACECWCKPGTLRVFETNACVPLEKCYA